MFALHPRAIRDRKYGLKKDIFFMLYVIRCIANVSFLFVFLKKEKTNMLIYECKQSIKISKHRWKSFIDHVAESYL